MKNREIRLLLVEDDEDDYLIMKNYLSKLTAWNIELQWVSAPEEALKIIDSTAFDIFFVDYMLGKLNGIELIQELKLAGVEAPIIMLTGKGSREIDLLAMQKGVSDFLEKNDLNPMLIERCIRYAMERSNTIKKLERSQERLKSVSEQLVGLQERERKSVAQELHDGVGSSLAAIKFALESKLDQIHKNKPWDKGIHIESIVGMASETMEEVRRISRNLRPPTLDSIGILATISWMIREFCKVHHDIQVESDIRIRESDVPESLKITVYRILQEVMTNVAKHSRADTVGIRLWKTDEQLKLEIADNGLGIEDMAQKEVLSGFGLESIKYRCELTNGILEIKTPPRQGLVLSVAWPI